MEMSNREIVHRYVDLETPISILAELNAVTKGDIRDVLISEGVEIEKGTLRPKRHIVDPKPAKPYQGEFKERKKYTHSGLYTKEAKEARRKANQQLKKALEEAGYKTSENKNEGDKKEMATKTKTITAAEKATEAVKSVSEKIAKAAEPLTKPAYEMNDTLKNLVYSRLDELEVKMGYHQEQLREYERQYKELCKSIGIDRKYEIEE